MYIDPVNPIIKKTLSDMLTKELAIGEKAYDFDDVVYTVEGQPEESQVVYTFKCNAGPAIFENGGNELLEQEYADFSCPRDQWRPDADVTLAISTADFPKTQKIKKSMSEEEQNAIRASNEEVRA